jgi:hypothetical protein
MNPGNVSGTRFVSTSGTGPGQAGFPLVEPIVFEFDVPIKLFGLTTIDLLEDGATCNPGGAHLALRAYDASDMLVDEHARAGARGPGGLDLDWFVSGEQIVKVELIGGSLGDCTGYGIDDLVLVVSPPADDLEDIGPDCTAVTTRVIDGVTVNIFTAGGFDMTARTYNDATCDAFWGRDALINTPLNPGNVSGRRFISSRVPQAGFPEAEPIIFEFDTPVTLFGLTTLDLLEDCHPANAYLALQAYDALGSLLDTHARSGAYGSGGLDLDWSVSDNQIVRVELTGANLENCPGYGIDDLLLVSADCDADGIPDNRDSCACMPAPAGVDILGRPLGDTDLDCDVDLHDYGIMQNNFTGAR